MFLFYCFSPSTTFLHVGTICKIYLSSLSFAGCTAYFIRLKPIIKWTVCVLLLMEISVEYLLPQPAVATSHLYSPPSSTDRSRSVRKLQGQHHSTSLISTDWPRNDSGVWWQVWVLRWKKRRLLNVFPVLLPHIWSNVSIWICQTPENDQRAVQTAHGCNQRSKSWTYSTLIKSGLPLIWVTLNWKLYSVVTTGSTAKWWRRG